MNQYNREPGVYLNTLAFRATPGLVGEDSVYVRHLDKETEKLWSDFDRQCKQRFGDESAQAPYSIATTVLSVISGGYVFFDPDFRNPFLASREPLSNDLLRRVFTLTYRLSLGEPIETIDLRDAPELAKLISATPETTYKLSDFLTPRPLTQPETPGWVYRTIAWGISQKLAKTPWELASGRTITLCPDTTGGLVAIDQPWENEQRGRYALSRTALQLKTLPNITAPVLIVTSRVTRISSSMIFSKTALAIQPGEGRPVLEVSLNGRGGARTVNHLALQALGRLEMEYSILRAISERSQTEQQLLADAKTQKTKAQFPKQHPGNIWPVLPKSYTFPIGVGTGMQHLRDLHQHFNRVYRDAAEPLVIRQTSMTLPHRPTDPERPSKKEIDHRKQTRAESDNPNQPLRARGNAFPESEPVIASLKAAGFSKLRIACLWYRDETRLRMLGTLCKTYGLNPAGLDPREGQEIALQGDHLTAVFHHAPAFLKPGPPNGRSLALQDLNGSLKSGNGTLTAAWCETEIPTAQDFPDLKPQELDDLDAKHQTRTILSGLGVPTQYILGRNDNGAISAKATDHPAEMALLDLHRSLGIVDNRIANALTTDASQFSYATDRIAHVGIHIRQQNKRKGESSAAKVVITASALIPPVLPGSGTWAMLGWSSTKPSWQPYRLAQTAFHATAYPQDTTAKKTSRQRWDEAADAIEQALSNLAEELDGIPYIVTVDDTAGRRIWDGLKNNKQGAAPQARFSRHWLPGHTLDHDRRPDAVIRLNIADDTVPPPIGTTRILKSKPDDQTEGQTTRVLYEVATDFGSPIWILCNVPRGYDGEKAGRLGSKYTRWDAKLSVQSEVKEERRKGEMPQNWYTMTATEIFPIACRPGIPEEAIAFATAQLCHQTLFWSDRSRFPVPLHSSKQMDLDHPQYRRTIVPEEKPMSEPGADEVDTGRPEDAMSGDSIA